MVKKENYTGQVEVRFGLSSDGGPNIEKDSVFSVKVRHTRNYPDNADADENTITLPKSLSYRVDVRLPDGSEIYREIEGGFVPKTLFDDIPTTMREAFDTSALLAEEKGYLKSGKSGGEFREKFNRALSLAQDWFYVEQCKGYVGLIAPRISDEGTHPQEGYRIFSIKD